MKDYTASDQRIAVLPSSIIAYNLYGLNYTSSNLIQTSLQCLKTKKLLGDEKLVDWQIVQIRYHGTVSAAGHDFEKNVRIKHGKSSLWWFGIHIGSKCHASRSPAVILISYQDSQMSMIVPMDDFWLTWRYSDGLQTERSDNFIKYHMNKIEPCSRDWNHSKK